PVGLSKEPRHPKMDGVSTNLALIFGTLLSSQGTDASFVLTLAGFPPGFPSVFRVSSLADPISRFCHPLERAAGHGIHFRAFRSRRGQTLPGFLGPPDHSPGELTHAEV
ncbi:hypothetical protein ACFRJ7_35500, partial [Streptomyces sp. NPDC056747]|uniref:hypothetical protein n=1 Tax=Streptomyces sp. NPDC056747 TaxID=3345935 RepID=UPI00368BDD51